MSVAEKALIVLKRRLATKKWGRPALAQQIRHLEKVVSAERRRTQSAGAVYLIEADQGYCIGKTISLQQRERAYRTHNPSARLIASFPGYTHEEKDALTTFAHLRLPGYNEWFQKDDAILVYFGDRQGDHGPDHIAA